MAALSNEALPSEQKSQSLIGKVSESLQLPLEVPVAIETVSILRSALRTAHALFILLFEQKKQHLWHSCCPISLVISNMKFNRKLSEQFWRIWCFPIQSDRSCSWMPERRFKDGRRVTGLVLKRLWPYVNMVQKRRRVLWAKAHLTLSHVSLKYSIWAPSVSFFRRPLF